tara:strand:+ start:1115 stop:1585 length:471 start_codon:yes stop_codon:yes gene_type:complete
MTDAIIYTVIASLVALGVIFTLHAIYRPKGLGIAIFMIFISLSTPLALYKPFVEALGFPVYAENSGKEELITHTVSPDQVWIYIWVIDFESGEPRAYKFPYSKESEKALAEAKEKTEQGVQQGIEIPPPISTGNVDTPVELEIEDLYQSTPGGAKV